jgi:hypothetical protein
MNNKKAAATTGRTSPVGNNSFLLEYGAIVTMDSLENKSKLL